MKRLIICVALTVTGIQMHGQWGLTGNGTTNPTTNYLGTTDNNALMLRTNATQRLRINANQSYTIGSYAAQAKNGAVGLSPNNNLWSSGPGPFSRLHLHDGTTSVLSASYRPWMDNGITFTTNSDHMYVGHKVEAGSDQTAAVIQWGDNDAPTAGPDVMKFIFSTTFTGGAGPNSTDGLEIGRFHPQGWFGLGNWQAGANQPDERLDLLNRTIRLRDFTHPTLYKNNTYDRILVANPTDGRVYWRDVGSIGCSSGWTLNGTNAVTAYNGNPCPPQAADRVGIGAVTPLLGKLHVEHTNTSGTGHVGVYTKVVGGSTATAFQSSTSGASSNRGVFAEVTGGSNNIGVIGAASGGTTNNMAGQFQATGGLYGVGVEATSSGSSSTSRGLKALAANATYTYGVDGFGQVGAATVTDVIGVRGIAESFNNATRTIGVYGDNVGTAGGNTWAFWSDGFTFSMGGANWLPSDENLKRNIEDVVDASAILAHLEPKSYEYNGDAYPFLAFNQGRHFGIMAQQLEEVLPEAVREVTRPADLDEEGNEIVPEATFKAVNYEALVPLLIASNKEQQARLDHLEQMLLDCCNRSTPDGDRSMEQEQELLNERFNERSMQVVPNPFQSETTIHYNLEKGGRVQLMANSADGKQLQVLSDNTSEAGVYQFNWSTGDLAAGMYYVTLLLDGEPITKRAVKIDR